MEQYLLDTLSNIESFHSNCGILLTGDFNRLDVSQVTNHFRFKQLVDFATRGDNTLDLILTNWNEYYLKPVKLPPFDLSDHCTVTIYPKVRSKCVKPFKKNFIRDMCLSSKQALGRYLTLIGQLLIFSRILKKSINSLTTLYISDWTQSCLRKL